MVQKTSRNETLEVICTTPLKEVKFLPTRGDGFHNPLKPRKGVFATFSHNLAVKNESARISTLPTPSNFV
jgi:hypothetical protein